MFAFTFLGVHVDRSVNMCNGTYVFNVNGMVHHGIGPLIPADGHSPEYVIWAIRQYPRGTEESAAVAAIEYMYCCYDFKIDD